MDPIEFFQTAQELLAKNAREADRRSCVSRVYYWIYQLLRVEVLKIDFRVRDNAGLGGRQQIAHIKICNALIGLGRTDKKTESIGRKLDGLREYRNKADYNIEVPLSFAVTQEQLENAKDIYNEISALGGAAPLIKRLEDYLKHS